MVENAVGLYTLPLGIATNFTVAVAMSSIGSPRSPPSSPAPRGRQAGAHRWWLPAGPTRR